MSSAHQNLSDQTAADVTSAKRFKIGIAISEWNTEITDALLQGAKETCLKYGVSEDNIIVHYVPGTFELPFGAQLMLDKLDIDAVICIGCVIQGETKHFDFICSSVANGIQDVQIKFGKPVIFGVLTPDNMDQAKARAGGKYGNKGDEAAITAIKMIDLSQTIINSASS
ncbi:MAG: 6,7-dimethyl-8-ribityllumazine synthase [Flavobacteriales bacterium]|nr:6,7-dimethyl-8-ribityllumazine synthase [Flavobacteriales bacterium]